MLQKRKGYTVERKINGKWRFTDDATLDFFFFFFGLGGFGGSGVGVLGGGVGILGGGVGSLGVGGAGSCTTSTVSVW